MGKENKSIKKKGLAHRSGRCWREKAPGTTTERCGGKRGNEARHKTRLQPQREEREKKKKKKKLTVAQEEPGAQEDERVGETPPLAQRVPETSPTPPDVREDDRHDRRLAPC